ncbi:exit from mitosis regulator [Malassezia pachydermatis]|uniref:Nuclear rim protein 1 n=1 Tax=Malassezia pachydermatis TaxID=77020 RepID=A0A0M8MQF2_9BASI|nr:hypothetical protein Malapachy_1157 [Malassezia pachydermatis]KOS14757.1 hypothetical protein Malapachy_1157 [Malassezia pachydermatis]
MVREVSRREPHAPRPSYHTMSPYVQRAIHGTPPPPSTPRRRWPSTPAQASPLHLKVAYASPRAMASQTSNAADAEESDTIPPRSNTWQDRMEQLPSMAMAYLQDWWMDLASFLHQTSMGLPMGLLLHALSLLSQVMLPDSSFSLRAASRPSHRASSLFASKRREADMHGQHAYSARLGHMILAQRVAALQFTSRMLSLVLLVLAIGNAYLLFSKRRTYRLWYRDERSTLRNPHASLEAPPTDPAPGLTWGEWAHRIMIHAARQVPIVEWFVPPPPPPPAQPPTSERVYTLRVWDVYEAPLRLFTVYSPAHALWWAVAGSMGMSAFMSWIVTAVLMALFSVQSWFLAQEYHALVQDRQVLSAEMLREYDEKFVIPRAMPVVRDAATQTA